MPICLPYCGDLVREYDPDRYLISLFAPDIGTREALWALFAFNHEIAKTREVVSETQLGHIRLQWWRDAIAAIYEGEGAPEHEVLKPLATAIKAYALPQEAFNALIYAREFDLEDVVPDTLDGLVNYADFTNTPLMTLAVLICGGDPDREPVQAIAVNYALAGLLRAMRPHARQRRYYLPRDLCERYDVRYPLLTEGAEQEGLPDVIEAIGDLIEPGIKCDTPVLKATQALAVLYRKKLAACGWSPHHKNLLKPLYFKELRLLWQMIRL